MNQIEINKIKIGGKPYWQITDIQVMGGELQLTPSQMKELKEKIAKLDL